MDWKSYSLKVLSLILPVVGVLAGALLANYSNESLWHKKYISEQRKEILTKRTQILEDVTVLLNSTQTIKDVNMYLRTHADLAEQARDCAENTEKYKMTLLECTQLMDTRQAFEQIKLRTRMTAEYGKLVHLSGIYFGKKTAQYAVEMSKLPRWWEGDTELFANYLAAMQEEMTHFSYTPMLAVDK